MPNPAWARAVEAIQSAAPGRGISETHADEIVRAALPHLIEAVVGALTDDTICALDWHHRSDTAGFREALGRALTDAAGRVG